MDSGAPLKTTEVTPEVKPKSPNKFKKYFFYVLIAGVVVAALISVIAVLVGEFNSIMSKALITTASMVFHTLLILMLISAGDSKRSKTAEVLMNALVAITVASFITSFFTTWDILTGKIVGQLYLLYLYAFLAVSWSLLLSKVSENSLDKTTRIVSRVGMTLTAILFALLVPTVFANNPDDLPEIYYRGLAAMAILLSTASVLVTVFHRVFVFKHPESKQLKSSKPAWDIVIAVVILFVGLPAIFSLISVISSYNAINNTDYSDSTDVVAPEKSTEPANNEANLVYKDCSTLPEFKAMKLTKRDGSDIFRSHDQAQKEVVLQTTESKEEVIYVYEGTLSVLDENCQPLDVTTLKRGDTIVTYTVPEPSQSNQNADGKVFQKVRTLNN